MRRQNLQSPMQFMMDYLRRNLLLNSSVADLYVSRRKTPRVSSGSKDNFKIKSAAIRYLHSDLGGARPPKVIANHVGSTQIPQTVRPHPSASLDNF